MLWSKSKSSAARILARSRGVANQNSANIGEFAAVSHRKISQFGGFATTGKGKNGQNWNGVPTTRKGKYPQTLAKYSHKYKNLICFNQTNIQMLLL